MLTEEVTFEQIAHILRIPGRFRQEKDIKCLQTLTDHVEFFKRITNELNSHEIHKNCCEVMTLEEYGRGDIIIKFGEQGEKFYIILRGNVSVMIPVKKSVKLRKDQISQYKNLNSSESSSLKSESDSDDSEDIDNIPLPIKKERREGIPVASVSEILKKLQLDKKNSIKHQKENFGLNDEMNMAKLFKKHINKETKDLIKVIKSSDNEFIEIEINKHEEVSILSAGDSFGELALISDRPRSATIVAKERVSLLVINKTQFRKILGNLAEKRMNSKLKFIQSLSYFNAWSKTGIFKIAAYFQSFVIARNQTLFFEGKEAKELYFIKEGEFLISKKCQIENNFKENSFSKTLNTKYRKILVKNKPLNLCIKGANESIGGYEILNNIKTRIFSSICISSTAEVYFVLKEHLLSKIPSVESITKVIANENSRLIERYNELCEIESNNKQTILREKAQTPNPIKIFSKKKFEFPSLSPKTYSTTAKSIGMSIKTKTFRKLTQIEIERAVNGRVRKKTPSPVYVVQKVRKRSPPLNFMLSFR